LVATFLPQAAPAKTIYVPDDQPTIQAGIDAAEAGDTVLVRQGWYQELGIRMKSGVHLQGEDVPYSLVTIGSFAPSSIDEDAIICDGVDATATIERFSFDGNYLLPGTFHSGIRCTSSDVTIRNCRFENWKGPGLHLTNSSPHVETSTFSRCGSFSVNGGGVYAKDSSPTLTNCFFSLTEAANGGGVWCGGTTSAGILGCQFNGCAADTNGGSIYCEDATVVRGCTFKKNSDLGSARNGGGIACSGGVTIQSCSMENLSANRGGGIYIILGNATLNDCWITGCQAGAGGAICAATGSHSISYSWLSGNGAQDGGAVAVLGGEANVDNILAAGNYGNTGAGGIHVADAAATIVRCTIANNIGQAAPAAGIVAMNANVDLRQSIVRFSCGDRRMDLAATSGSTVEVECCNIDPVRTVQNSGTIVWDSGNFTLAPSFCYPTHCEGSQQRDLHLTSDSPCLPENNSCGLLIGALDACSTTSIEPRSWGSIKAGYR
jgi:hypothetical protein